MRHISKLDISMFIEYANRSGRTDSATLSEIIEIEREIDRELEKFGEIKIEPWKDY